MIKMEEKKTTNAKAKMPVIAKAIIALVAVGALIAAIVAGVNAYQKNEFKKKREQVKTDILEEVSNNGYSYSLPYGLYSFYGDEEMEQFLCDQMNTLFSEGEYEKIAKLLAALEDRDYQSETINNVLAEFFSEKADFSAKLKLQMISEKREFTYYKLEYKLTEEDVRAYLETHESEKPKGLKPGEEPEKNKKRVYTGQYGAYRDYYHTYYGELEEVSYSGYSQASAYDLTSVHVSGHYYKLKGFELDTRPDLDRCVYSKPYLFVEDDNGIAIYGAGYSSDFIYVEK